MKVSQGELQARLMADAMAGPDGDLVRQVAAESRARIDAAVQADHDWAVAHWREVQERYVVMPSFGAMFKRGSRRRTPPRPPVEL